MKIWQSVEVQKIDVLSLLWPPIAAENLGARGVAAQIVLHFQSNFIRHILNHTDNLLKPTDYVTHQQFNIQQLYVLPTLYLCVLYLSENKQRFVPLTA